LSALLYVPDYGTRERWQHATRRYELTGKKKDQSLAARVVEECVLDVLHGAGKISDAEREAGLKLRLAYVRARIERPQTARYDAQPRQHSSNGREFVRSAREEEAYQEWRAALLAVSLHDMDSIITVCCVGNRPTAKQWISVRRGLEALVIYYDL